MYRMFYFQFSMLFYVIALLTMTTVLFAYIHVYFILI
jgi:hypothetical protein